MPPNPHTLFHLVPINKVAHEALLHPDNKRFVSESTQGSLGLEVGYHVSFMPRGHVITRLGRNADLMLCDNGPGEPLSAVHVEFEINPVTELIVLSVRSKRIASVKTAVLKTTQEGAPEEFTGDGVILYTKNYEISLASYRFQLLWLGNSEESSRSLVLQDYQTSLQLQRNVRTRDRPTEADCSEATPWHVTRLAASKNAQVQDIPQLREWIGGGSYGDVYQATDQKSGNLFAVKVIKLQNNSKENIRRAKALLRREITVMEGLQHPNVIEYLGQEKFETLSPAIFMPLREGSLTSLVTKHPIANDVKWRVLHQMLSALDYLASQGLCHRDVKPDRILYYKSPGNGDYHFQLADFGLTSHRSLATTLCGTISYQAPELWPQVSQVHAKQSPKMDVFSLAATMIAIGCCFQGFPPDTSDYHDVLSAVRDTALEWPYKAMVRLHPEDRASAAQMLVVLLGGEGLTTPPVHSTTHHAYG